MEKETIPSLTDEAWAKQDELGTMEKVLEYTTQTGTQKVKAVAHIVSGSEVEALTATHTKIDKDGKPSMDSKTFQRDLMKLVFRMNGNQIQAIFDHKSNALRSQMATLANEACGASLDADKVEEQKNSASPGQSQDSSQ